MHAGPASYQLLFIEVCSEPTEMHCSSTQGKIYSPLFTAALQNRLTAGLCHCKYTHRYLLFIQVFSEPTEMHCSTSQDEIHLPLFVASVQNRLTAGLCHRKYTHRLVMHLRQSMR